MWIRWTWRLSFKTFCNSTKRRVAVEKRWRSKARQDCSIAFNFHDWCFCKETYKETFGTSPQSHWYSPLGLGVGGRISHQGAHWAGESSSSFKVMASVASRNFSFDFWFFLMSFDCDNFFTQVNAWHIKVLASFSGVVKQQVRLQ